MTLADLIQPAVIHSREAVIYANQEFAALVGAEAPPELSNRSLESFVARSDQAYLFDSFNKILDGDDVRRRHHVTIEGIGDREYETIAISMSVLWNGESRIRTVFLNMSQPDPDVSNTLGESALDQAPVGITVADVTLDDDPLIYANGGFSTITGYSQEEILGKNCRFLQGEGTRDEPVATMRTAIDAERPVTVELRNYRKDGTEFWNRVTLSPVESSGGTVTHYLGFQEDISSMKSHQKELLLFQTYAERSDEALFITDTDGVIEYVNPAFERTTGYSAAEAIGQTPRILKSGKHDETFYAELWETITAGETWEGEIINQSKSGERYTSVQQITPIENSDGDISHYVALERDVTEQRIKKQILDVLNRILRHNVRNSVTVIDGYADLIASGVGDVDVQAVAETIRNEAATLESIGERTGIIRRLVALLESDEEPVPMNRTEIIALVEQYQSEHEDAEITLAIDETEPHQIKYGAVFKVALKELIENAIAHNDQDTPQISITVTKAADTDEAVIKVADNGPDIPKSLWEIIKLGEETSLRHAEGIGLWLVYWSIDLLGGKIHLGSNEPRGNVITMQVPIDN